MTDVFIPGSDFSLLSIREVRKRELLIPRKCCNAVGIIFQVFLQQTMTKNQIKSVWGFLFCLDLELFAKIKKDLVSTYSFFTFLLITQDLNKIKKSRTPFCRHC